VRQALRRAPSPPGAPLLLIGAAVLFTAVALWHEVAVPLPSTNDDANHFLWIQRASDALARGENPSDPWVAEMELGFPPFAHYQGLPHLFVVLAHRVLLGFVDLLTVFNLTRWLLLSLLPLTVFWSLRRIGLSPLAAAFAGAAAPLVSADHLFGFEYESYLWRGFGMYTQLWAMHASFVALACVHTVLERGRGHRAAALALATLALSHLIYAYMLGITLVVLVLAAHPRRVLRRAARLAAVVAPAAVISAFSIVPFLLERAYLHVSVYTLPERYDSFGAPRVLEWLARGELFDQGRPPVLTALLGVGVAAALVWGGRLGRTLVALFALWLVLYAGRPTLGPLVDLLPFHEGLLLHRFIGGVHLFGLVLIGIGAARLADAVMRLAARAGERARPLRALAVRPGLVAGAALALLLVPAFAERAELYAGNASFMSRTRAALDADGDASTALARLHELPPGRVFAGLGSTWQAQALQLGLPFRSLRFVDLLTFERLQPIALYTGWSLNSELVFHFDEREPAHYALFGIRYVLAPAGLAVPEFLRPILRTSRYNLYEAPGGGYARFVALAARVSSRTGRELFETNLEWVRGERGAGGAHLLHEYPARERTRGPLAVTACASGALADERVAPARLEITAECRDASVLAFKTTFHPNWRVTVDGADAATFMVSPSYLAVELPAGRHRVVAEYRSPPLRAALVIAGLAALVALVAAGGRLREAPFVGEAGA
jgi:hypothetical protein